jgi:hypothetical protein
MKKIALMLLLIPAIANADVIPTRTLEPVVRIVEDTIYVTDKKGNDWAIVTNCQINAREIKEFTVRGKVLRSGRVVKLSDQKHCEIETIQAA